MLSKIDTWGVPVNLLSRVTHVTEKREWEHDMQSHFFVLSSLFSCNISNYQHLEVCPVTEWKCAGQGRIWNFLCRPSRAAGALLGSVWLWNPGLFHENTQIKRSYKKESFYNGQEMFAIKYPSCVWAIRRCWRPNRCFAGYSMSFGILRQRSCPASSCSCAKPPESLLRQMKNGSAFYTC